MADDTARTCPPGKVKDGFWPDHEDPGRIIHLGMTDTKIFVKGELTKDDGSGGMTNGAQNITCDLWSGIAQASMGTATAAGNDDLLLPVYVPVMWNEFFWVAADGTVNGAACFAIWDFTDKNGVASGTAASAGEVGFKAYAYDSTNSMFFGVFAVQG